MKIKIPKGCDNAPKKQTIIAFNSAFAEVNIDKVLSFLSDKVVWEMVGNQTIIGKTEVRKILENQVEYKAKGLTIEHIITHGALASADGFLDMGKITVAFCDIYEFTSAGSHTIKSIKSYIMEVPN